MNRPPPNLASLGRCSTPVDTTEEAGFMEHRGELVHYVFHRPDCVPRGKVLLAGPLPDERTHAHLTWVRWARHLAERGFMVMRFDYRGTGESTGRFEATTLADWMNDLVFCLEKLKGDSEQPVVIHGLRMGGMVAARAFGEGHGGALLAWAPPESGEAAMVDAARRQQAANLVQGIAGGVPGPKAIAETLEKGQPAEINGYVWSPEFWREAKQWRLLLPGPPDLRQHLQLRLGRRAVFASLDGIETLPISWPPFWVVGHRMIHDVDELFARSLRFVEAATTIRTEAS